MSVLVQQFKAARGASTPLLAILTPDPAATISAVVKAFNGEPPPILHWDIVRGIRGINKPGAEAAAGIAENPQSIIAAVEALIAFDKLPAKCIAIMANAHRILAETGVSQAIWNLRDPFKSNKRTLILLGPTLNLPVELQQDVSFIDDPLPSAEQLSAIVSGTYSSADLAQPKPAVIEKATDAIIGLAAFSAEQVCAESITKDGIDMEKLWERKRRVIEQQPGLSIWRGKERFADIGGYANLKNFLGSVIQGRKPPRSIIFIDEIEKGIGTGMDTSGVSQNILGQLLTWMQDNEAIGLLLIGPPGTSKSMFAKATGNEAGVPTIALDLGGVKGSLVGESEANLRNALKVCDVVSQKQAFFLATCNSIHALPPELRRRFNLGVVFCDLPDEQERAAIWKLYISKYKLAEQRLPKNDGWTGAEIKQCCWLAWDLKLGLMDAANFVVPVARSAAAQIEQLRDSADGRYLSASAPGIYKKTPAVFEGLAVATSRKLDLSEKGVN